MKRSIILFTSLAMIMAPRLQAQEIPVELAQQINSQYSPETRLIVRKGVAGAAIPLKAVCPDLSTGSLSISGDHKKRSGLKVGRFLPRLPDGQPGDESRIEIVDTDMKKCTFTYQTAFPDDTGNVEPSSSLRIGAHGIGWTVYINYPNFREAIETAQKRAQTLEALSAFALPDPSQGSVEETFDENWNPVSNGPGKKMCLRAFDPNKKSKWRGGIVVWSPRERPGNAGYSLKNDHLSSENPNLLRCPSGPGQTDWKVDGIYRTSWRNKALKIPDHCTLTLDLSNNRRIWRKCCTPLLSTLFGKPGFINPADPVLVDWPDRPKNRC